MLKKPITSRESDSNNTWQELQDTIGEIRYEWLESTDFRNFTREESIQELKSIIWEFFEMTSIFRQNPEKWKKIAEDFHIDTKAQGDQKRYFEATSAVDLSNALAGIGAAITKDLWMINGPEL